MNELIKTKEDLINYLTITPLASKAPPDFVYVTAKLRKEILIGPEQGRFCINGRYKNIEFCNMGDGVYCAHF